MKTALSKQTKKAFILMSLGIFAMLMGIVLSIAFGSTRMDVKHIFEAIFRYDAENSKHLIITSLRLPRTLASLLVGSALAVAGAVMQGMTRNPLADSGLLGISAGAVFMLALVLGFFPGLSYQWILILTFLGSSMSGIIVFGLAHAGGKASPVKMVLAGACLSGLLSSLSQAIAIAFNMTQSLAFWTMGSLSGATLNKLAYASPLMLLGFTMAFILSKNITVLSMGEDVAVGLGVNIRLIKALGTVTVILLAGTSVALAGMVGFVGLIIPHVVRTIVGPNYARIIPCSAVLGAVLLVYSDLLAKTLIMPSEIPVGAITAMIGAPMFLYIARRGKQVKA